MKYRAVILYTDSSLEERERESLNMSWKTFKVACWVQIWKKNICQNGDKFGYSFIKNDIIFMYILCIYKKTIILSLFKIETLNFTMDILKIYVIELHNLILMNIFK